MKRNRIRILLLCLFLLCLSACGKSEQDAENSTGNSNFIDRLGKKGSVNKMAELPEEDPDYREKTTVMIYMIGSDLESGSAAATNDLKEMEESGVDLEQVTLLVYAGGAEQWHNDLTADKNTLLKLTKDGFQKEKDFDLMSMGDPENLSRFLSYAYENYPADRFHLLFWDHGNGPVMGYGKDMLFDGDSLTLSELRTALEKSPFGPEKKLGIIGFDACLMASVELACVTGDYADYLISSQEVEPNYGWNYTFLKKCGRTTSDWLAKQIVDDYVSYNETYNSENEFSNNDATLSVIDLSHAAELQAAVDQMFSSAVEDVSGDFNQLVKARVGTRGLGRASTGSEYDLVDLNHLAETMQKRYPEQTIQLQTVLDQAVLINQSSIANCGGLSLYYPYYNKKYYSSVWKEEYEKLNLFPNYKSYLDRYEDIWLGTDLKELYDGELVPQNGKTDMTYSLQLTDEQMQAMASSEYYIVKRAGGGLYWPIYASTGVRVQDNTLIAEFDGKIIYAVDDYGDRFIPLMKAWDSYDGVTELSLKGFFAPYDEKHDTGFWTNATYRLNIDENTDEISVNGIYEGNFMLYDSEDGLSTGKKEQIDFSQYNTYGFAHVSPRYLTRDENGRIKGFWEWPSRFAGENNEAYLKDGLHFTYEPLYDDGFEYFLLFDIADIQDNHTCSELLPIQLVKEEEKETDITEIEWNPKDSTQTIYEGEGITIDLIAGKKIEDGSLIFMARITNDNDYQVNVELSDGRINDRIDVGTNYISVSPHSTEYNDIGSYGQKAVTTCQNLGVNLESYDFCLIIQKKGPEGYTIHRDNYKIKGIDQKLDNTILPLLGAKAEAQVLYDEDGVVIRIEGAGFLDIGMFSTPEDKTADFKTAFVIENHSNTEKRIRIGNAVINGWYMNACYMNEYQGYLNLYPFEMVLLPGERCYSIMCIEKSEIEELGGGSGFQESVSPRKKIEEIETLSFYVKVDEKETLLPISLSEHGSYVKETIDGTVLYEDDVFQCVLEGKGKVAEDDKTRQYWYMSMTNKTDRPIMLLLYNSESRYITSILIGSQATIFNPWFETIEEDEKPYLLQVKRQDNLDLEEYTDPFTIELSFD